MTALIGMLEKVSFVSGRNDLLVLFSVGYGDFYCFWCIE